MPQFRSLLFAPAIRPERFSRAIESGADAVCIDLEDATPPDRKAEGRAAAAQLFARRAQENAGGPHLGVRINSTDSPWWEDDLAALDGQADFVMAPKATSAEQMGRISILAPGCRLWPLIETAQGVRNAWETAAAEGVVGVVFGAFDYAADVGCTMEWEPLLFARSAIAAACAAARVQAMDSPSGDLTDVSGLAESTRRAQALGFTGRACIHPNQVEPVNAAFTPTAAEVAQAERVLAAFEAAHGGAATLDGRLIELPVALAARRTLARRIN